MEREITITHKIRTSKCGNFCSFDCDFNEIRYLKFLKGEGSKLCSLFEEILNDSGISSVRLDICKGYDK